MKALSSSRAGWSSGMGCHLRRRPAELSQPRQPVQVLWERPHPKPAVALRGEPPFGPDCEFAWAEGFRHLSSLAMRCHDDVQVAVCRCKLAELVEVQITGKPVCNDVDSTRLIRIIHG